MPVRTYGVDVSVWNPRFPWEYLERHGDFAIIKATQDYWRDGGFRNHFAKAKQTNLVLGAYHFLMEPGAGRGTGYRDGKGCTEPSVQAANFVKTVRQANGGTLDGVIMCLDWENLNTSLGYKVNSSPRFSHVVAFAYAYFKLAPNHPLFIYAGGHLPGNDLRVMKKYGPVYLWLARWTVSSPNQIGGRTNIPESSWRTRYGGMYPTIIQYQSGSWGGRVNKAHCDLNASNLTKEELKRFTHQIGSGNPDPDPDPNPDPPDPENPPDPEPVPNPWQEPWFTPTGEPTKTGAAAVGGIGFAGVIIGAGVVALMAAGVYLAYSKGKVKTPVISALQELTENG